MGDSGVRMRGLPGTSAAVACGLVASGQAGAWRPRARPAAPSPPRWRRSAAHRAAPPGHRGLLPTAGRGTVLLDAGATADPTPEMLAQFAVPDRATPGPSWASSHPRWACSRSAPSRGKGNRLARRAQPCSAPRRSGSPATWKGATRWLAQLTSWSPTASPARGAEDHRGQPAPRGRRHPGRAGRRPGWRVAQFANRGRLRRLAERFDADAHGGAVLLGLGGTVVIAHGSARARAITRACLLARDLVRAGITGQVGRAVAGITGQRPSSMNSPVVSGVRPLDCSGGSQRVGAVPGASGPERHEPGEAFLAEPPLLAGAGDHRRVRAPRVREVAHRIGVPPQAERRLPGERPLADAHRAQAPSAPASAWSTAGTAR